MKYSIIVYRTGPNFSKIDHEEVSPSIDLNSTGWSHRRARWYEERQVYFQGTEIWNIDSVTLIEFLPWEVITKMFLQY